MKSKVRRLVRFGNKIVCLECGYEIRMDSNDAFHSFPNEFKCKCENGYDKPKTKFVDKSECPPRKKRFPHTVEIVVKKTVYAFDKDEAVALATGLIRGCVKRIKAEVAKEADVSWEE